MRGKLRSNVIKLGAANTLLHTDAELCTLNQNILASKYTDISEAIMRTPDILIHPSQFDLTEFYESNPEFINAYVELRARGYHETIAFRRVFGAINSQDNFTQHRIDSLESNPYFTERFEARLKTIPIDQVLNERIALNWLLRLSSSPYAKDTVRLAAMRDAAVLAGVTVIDDAGNTRKAGRSLDDFYKSTPSFPAGGTRHPAPGSKDDPYAPPTIQ